MHFRDWSVRSQRCTCLRDEESEKTESQGGGFESYHFLSLKKSNNLGLKGPWTMERNRHTGIRGRSK